jgi:hypothetical protein
MSESLEQLAQEWKGELREKNLAGRVLADYTLIRRLRAQNCPWHRIAASMPGVNPDSLRKVFRWVDKRVKEGDLEPPEGGAPKAGKAGAGKGKPVEQDTGFRTPTTPKKEDSDDDRKWM